MATGDITLGMTTITVCPDGPLLLRGPAEIVGVDGEQLARTRSTLGLCRCGLSAIKPFCDGSHKAARFRSNDGRSVSVTDAS